MSLVAISLREMGWAGHISSLPPREGGREKEGNNNNTKQKKKRGERS